MKRILILVPALSGVCISAQEVKKDSISQEIEGQIQAVEIISKKKVIEKKSDRWIFNVEYSTAATGGDLIDVLKLIPGVMVQEDKISLIGKSGMLVLIDGHLTQLSGEELIVYLRSIKADEVKSIEVMTNPPAKYSAEGNSGVLNIVTKKLRKNTWNAVLRNVYQQGNFPLGNWQATFGLQKDKWTFSTSFQYLRGKDSNVHENTLSYPKTFWSGRLDGQYSQERYVAGLGLDYRISEKMTHGVSYKILNNVIGLESVTKTQVFNFVNNDTERWMRAVSDSEDKTLYHTLNYHWVYNLDDKNRKLSFDYDFLFLDADKSQDVRTSEYTKNWQTLAVSYDQDKTSLGGRKVYNHSFNIDMEHPLGRLDLNYGARFSFSKTKNNSQLLSENKKYSDRFNYHENTQALYGSIGKKFGEKWEIKAGLRMENTQAKGYSVSVNAINKMNYTQLFPTFYLSFTPSEYHSWSLDYGKRIRRPSYYFLNPFRYVVSEYAYNEGNPYLLPAFTHNVELEYAFKENSITTVYFSKTKADFEWFYFINVDTNVGWNVPQNFIEREILGFSQKFMFKPWNFWEARVSADVYYSSTHSTLPSSLQYLSGWSGVLSLTSDITLNKKKTLFLGIDYTKVTRGVSDLDYDSGGDQFNASLKWMLLNKKLVMNIYVNNIFDSYHPTYTSYSNGVETGFTNFTTKRYFRLSATYTLGKKLKNKEHQSKNQEEFNRAQ